MKSAGLQRQKLFIRIFSYFFLVLSMIILIGFVLYFYVSQVLERDAARRLQLNLDSAAGTVDFSMQNVVMSNVSLATNGNLIRYLKPYDTATVEDRTYFPLISNAMRERRPSLIYIDEVFLYVDEERVFTEEGTSNFFDFFTKFYSMEQYNAEYWTQKLKHLSNVEVLSPSMVSKSNYDRISVIPVVSVMSINGCNTVIASMVPAGRLTDVLEQQIAFPAAKFVLLNRKGELLASNDSGYFSEGVLNRLQNDIKGKEYCSLTLEGDRMLCITGHSSSYDWTYYCVMPFDELGGETSDLVLVLVFSCGALLLIGSLVSLLFSYRIYRPLSSIKAMISGYGEKAAQPEKGHAENEFRQISSGVEQMIGSFSQRVDSITVSYLENGLHSLLRSGFLVNLNSFEEILKSEMECDLGSFICCVFQFSYTGEYEKELSQAMGKRDICRLIRVFMSEGLHSFSFRHTKNCYVTVASVSNEAERKLLFQQAKEVLLAFRYDTKYCTVRAGIGEACPSLSQLQHSYHSALNAMENSGSSGQETPAVFQAESKGGTFYACTEHEERGIRNCLEAGDMVRLQALLQEILIRNAGNRQYIDLLMEELFSVGLRFLAARGAEIRELLDYKQRLSAECFEADGDLESREKYLLQFYREVFALSPGKPSSGSLISLIKSYVDENFRDPAICLEKVAEGTGISSKYASRIFREKMGQKFTDYLGLLRINEAKRLLQSTSLSIEEIYGQVGIDSRSTFLRLFKKYEGVTPGVWRSTRPAPGLPSASVKTDEPNQKQSEESSHD